MGQSMRMVRRSFKECKGRQPYLQSAHSIHSAKAWKRGSRGLLMKVPDNQNEMSVFMETQHTNMAFHVRPR